MNKVIFLDRDGTINVEKHFLHDISDFEFIPGAVQALRLAQDKGFRLIVITNQSGLARGYYTEDDYNKLNSWMIKTLKEDYGVSIQASYFCPHLPDATIPKYRKKCICRKPRLGLFDQAIADHNISLEESYSIGDRIRDLTICKSRACRGFLINTTEDEKVRKDIIDGKYPRLTYATDLYAAVRMIINHDIE